MTGSSKNARTYAGAGVNIDRGNALVELIRASAASTARPGADAALGGFGALFDLKAAGFTDPILVAATDGVGTKLRIALDTGRHDTIGIDLVAMCVNDLIVQGAEPLFFLDYYACGTLSVETAAAVVAGIAEGCRQAGCALVGGETAEMPGFYGAGEHDLAGFAVGAAERGRLLPRADIGPGDRLLGIAASGVHSNGFALVRRLVADHGLSYGDPAPFDGTVELGAALLTPTRIYVRAARAALAAGGLKALAHITGGGLTENLPRVLPKGVIARITLSDWHAPPVFGWLSRAGGIEDAEMLRTFNCGIGLVAVVAADRVAAIRAAFEAEGERVFEIGALMADGTDPDARPRVRYDGAPRF